ncbi:MULTISPECIES: hypothetical protein [unclassified Nocardia]|uniref:hypothetical protein n=1 Tax=unclassified Nocardia TaxID=2637762 RepID=UPI00343A93A1
MLSKTSTSFRRSFARIAIAGALAAVPLSALAVTASAATADSSVPTVQAASDQIPLQGADIDRHHHGDWDGPRGDHDDRGPGDWRHGPGDQNNGPWQPGQPPILPPTGSAG